MKPFYKIIIVFLISVYYLNINANANIINPDSALIKAAKAYNNGEYEYAVNLYKTLYDEGYSSFELFYNLGNAYFKCNKIGLSILFYEKALLINPSDADIKYNLDLARTKIVDKPQEIKKSLVSNMWSDFRSILDAKLWGILSVSFFLIFFVSVAFFLLSRRPLFKKIFFYLGIVLLVSTFISLSFSRQQYKKLTNSKFAVIMVPTVTIKSSPDNNSVNLFVVHEGTKVSISDNISNWVEIRLSDGKTGWIKSDNIEKI